MGLELPPEIPREKRKPERPLIIPPGGGDPIAYERVSSFAGAVEDKYLIELWSRRHVAVGMARRAHLVDLAVGIIGNHDDPVDDAKWELNKLCDSAMEASESKKWANVGTALHGMTQALDRGRKDFPAGRWTEFLNKYVFATSDYDVIDAETFVVVDEIRAAGTLDRLVMCPDGRVRVADVKTGKWELQYPASTAAQVAVYAHGERYDPATGERSPLHPDLDLTSGLLIWLPVKNTPPSCQVVGLDLEAGWRRAQLALEVRKERARNANTFLRAEPYPGTPVKWTA